MLVFPFYSYGKGNVVFDGKVDIISSRVVNENMGIEKGDSCLVEILDTEDGAIAYFTTENKEGIRRQYWNYDIQEYPSPDGTQHYQGSTIFVRKDASAGLQIIIDPNSYYHFSIFCEKDDE